MARPRVEKALDEVITVTPSKVRCRYILDNKQLLSVYFTRRHVESVWGESVCYVWDVAVHVGRDRRKANEWFHGWNRRTVEQTGKCGLEALAVACRYVKMFGSTLGRKEEMHIGWADDKRRRAYLYLLRFDGFTLYEKDDGSPECIAYRNPNFYEWKEKRK